MNPAALSHLFRISFNKILNRISQLGQFAVKEVLGIHKYFKLGARIQFIDPGDGLLDVNQFILVTLDN